MALDEGRHVLDVLFAHAGEAVTVQDRSGLIFANDRAASMVGLRSGHEMVATPAEEIVASYEMIDRSGAPFAPDRLPGRRVLEGEPVAEELLGYRKRGTDEVNWSRVRSSPIKNDAGEVVLAINFFLDVTDQVRREEDERLLARARETLGTSLEIEAIVGSLAQLMLPALCTCLAVHLVDDAGALSLVGLAHLDSGSSARVYTPPEGQAPVLPDRLQARALRGSAKIVEGDPEDLVADLGDQARREVLAAMGEPGPITCLPLGTGDRALGTLTVARALHQGRISDHELTVLKSLTDRATVAFANSLLFTYERKSAEALQQGLMPARPPRVPGWETAVRYLPQARISGVGGDFYDLLPVTDDTLAVVVGDVEGKGISAAATVGVVRHTVRVTTTIDPDPAVVFRHVNATLCEQTPSRMCTLAYLTFHRMGDTAIVRVALAGHPPPVIVSGDGGLTTVGRPCPPAGVMPQISPLVHEHKMHSGDTIVLCTDGFQIGQSIPPDSLLPLLEGAQAEELDQLLDRLMRRLGDESQAPRDDVIVLALRLT